jgi:hypothetical protein
MIRKEYIKELKTRKEVIEKELAKVKPLSDELNHINSILESYNGASENGTKLTRTKFTRPMSPDSAKDRLKAAVSGKTYYPQKENFTWEKYILEIIALAGRKVKSKEVFNIVRDTNPDIDLKTIEREVRTKLWSLSKSGAITSQGNKNARSAGYLYWINEEGAKAP